MVRSRYHALVSRWNIVHTPASIKSNRDSAIVISDGTMLQDTIRQGRMDQISNCDSVRSL